MGGTIMPSRSPTWSQALIPHVRREIQSPSSGSTSGFSVAVHLRLLGPVGELTAVVLVLKAGDQIFDTNFSRYGKQRDFLPAIDTRRPPTGTFGAAGFPCFR